MPFSVLVQKKFSLRATTQAYDTIAIGGTRAKALAPIRKRRTNTNRKIGECEENVIINEIGKNHRAPVNLPAWVDHLNSLRCRSVYSTGAIVHHSTNLLRSTTRSANTKQPLHNSLLTVTTAKGSTIQARQCSTSTQYIKDIEELVQGNKTFRKETLSNYPRFFEESAKGQSKCYVYGIFLH